MSSADRLPENLSYFVAGEDAPSATEALTTMIPNYAGHLALYGFESNLHDPNSIIKLDDNVHPPVLHLKNAYTSVVFGSMDKNKNVFRKNKNIPGFHGILVNGAYSGPGSKLKLG